MKYECGNILPKKVRTDLLMRTPQQNTDCRGRWGWGWEGCPTGVVAGGVEHQDMIVPPPEGESVLPSFYSIHICFTRIFPALFSLLPQKPRTRDSEVRRRRDGGSRKLSICGVLSLISAVTCANLNGAVTRRRGLSCRSASAGGNSDVTLALPVIDPP